MTVILAALVVAAMPAGGQNLYERPRHTARPHRASFYVPRLDRKCAGGGAALSASDAIRAA